jgi:hypothetical protein
MVIKTRVKKVHVNLANLVKNMQIEYFKRDRKIPTQVELTRRIAAKIKPGTRIYNEIIK